MFLYQYIDTKYIDTKYMIKNYFNQVRVRQNNCLCLRLIQLFIRLGVKI